ncbi:hypothetical protein BC832DRAFT_77633 [Gaertneriomyces semiglobifer]|nr:hypothetical protein BC832DRAFT_77633 [Gaertneriomyces semiglobifer]
MSLVAPNLSLVYQISFTPDSLRNFTENWKVEIEGGTSFPIIFEGVRDKPAIDLKKVDCGVVRVNSYGKTVVELKNNGGSGRWRVLDIPASMVANIDFKELFEQEACDSTVQKGVFEISPSAFQIEKNGHGFVEVVCRPPALEPGAKFAEHTEHVYLACDDWSIHPLIFHAKAEKVSLSIVEIACEDCPSIKVEANRIIRDGDSPVYDLGYQHVGAEARYTLRIRNDSGVSIGYMWLWREDYGVFRSEGREEHEWGDDGTVRIEPSSGRLNGYQEMEFEIIVAPRQERGYEGVVQLRVLEEHHTIANDLLALEIPVTAAGVPYTLAISPPVLFFPGMLISGQTYCFHIYLTNWGVADVTPSFTFEGAQDLICEVEHTAVLPQQAAQRATLKITPKFVNTTVDARLVVAVAEQRWRMAMKGQIGVLGAVKFAGKVLDMGCVPAGKSTDITIALENTVKTPARFQVNVLNPPVEGEDNPMSLELTPTTGVLSAGEACILKGIYTSFRPHTWQGTVEVLVGSSDDLDGTDLRYSDSAVLKVTSTVPSLSIPYPDAYLTAFCGTPVTLPLTIQNDTALYTEFTLTHDSPQFGLTLPNHDHSIRPNARKDVQLSITPLMAGAKLLNLVLAWDGGQVTTPLHIQVEKRKLAQKAARDPKAKR